MPSELRPSADLSSWASATPAENSANLQRAARWCGAKAAPQANTRNLGSLSWWGRARRGHGQTAWHGAYHHDQRQRDQKMLRRTDKGVTFLFVGIFVGTYFYKQKNTVSNQRTFVTFRFLLVYQIQARAGPWPSRVFLFLAYIPPNSPSSSSSAQAISGWRSMLCLMAAGMDWRVLRHRPGCS